MKNLCFYIFFVFLSGNLAGQVNLVPNFSFEQFDTCPNAEDQIHFATSWSKYSVSISTPDYYNSCAPSNSFGVPKSIAIYQTERRNCNGYAGLITWGPTFQPYREHIGIQLSQPLTIGQKYYLSFYSVMGEVVITGNYYGMPSNNIGLRLSTVAYNQGNSSPIDNFAHLYSPAIINDTVNWTRISGSIIADSAYNYLIMGNFFDDANTDTLHYNCGTCFNNESYYLIDDVCISTDSLLCNGGIDSLPCITSVNEVISDNGINVFPNPVYDFVTVSFRNIQKTEIMVYDVFGKEVSSGKAKNERIVEIDLTSFPSGIYFLCIINKENKNSVIKKIVKL